MADDKPMETESVNNAEINITSTPLLRTMVKQNDKIAKIVIKTDLGDITWKPTIVKEKYVDGFKVESNELMSFSDIPQKLKDICKKIEENGKCKLKVNYTLMKTLNAENQPVEYRFITSEKTLNTWEFI